jgi:aminoglycoside phosphotransferase
MHDSTARSAHVAIAALRAESDQQASLHKVVEVIAAELHDRHAVDDMADCPMPVCVEWRHLLGAMILDEPT